MQKKLHTVQLFCVCRLFFPLTHGGNDANEKGKKNEGARCDGVDRLSPLEAKKEQAKCRASDERKQKVKEIAYGMRGMIARHALIFIRHKHIPCPV